MPNWCENTLIIEGEGSMLIKWSEENKNKKTDDELSFQAGVPIENWSRELAIEKWGTKWEPTEISISSAYANNNEQGQIIYDFLTAWAPPTEWLKTISKKWPDLVFRLKYDEPGIGFFGVAKAINGIFEDKCIGE